mmetsp:Transcript_8204/g.27089  ORF Transcript_8204/g.27089 Transcript_8204/m.27089 type:complete len:257 (+) Transcript_8204:73-843(+)
MLNCHEPYRYLGPHRDSLRCDHPGPYVLYGSTASQFFPTAGPNDAPLDRWAVAVYRQRTYHRCSRIQPMVQGSVFEMAYSAILRLQRRHVGDPCIRDGGPCRGVKWVENSAGAPGPPKNGQERDTPRIIQQTRAAPRGEAARHGSDATWNTRRTACLHRGPITVRFEPIFPSGIFSILFRTYVSISQSPPRGGPGGSTPGERRGWRTCTCAAPPCPLSAPSTALGEAPHDRDRPVAAPHLKGRRPGAALGHCLHAG